MPAMLRRRLLALAAIFSIAFGALWPLVSAAKPHDPQVPVFLCTQSGVQQHSPATPADDFHCPLCIATAESIVPAVPANHAAPAEHAIAVVAPRLALPDHLFCARPPPSRAPPVLS
jgi:hypothetical protein